MVALIHNIQDDFWQPALTNTYDLSILVGVDRLCYCITDASKKLLTLRAYQLDTNYSLSETLPAILAQDNWLGMTFRNTTLICSTDDWQFIDSQDFNESIDYFVNAKTPLLQQSQPLYFAQKMVVFGLPVATFKTLNAQFKQNEVQYNGAALLNYWNNCLVNKDSEAAVFVHIQHQTLLLAYFNKHNFVDYKTYKFYASSDVLYAVLHFYQQHQLDPNIQALHISGELVEDSEVYKLLFKYIRHIHFLPANERLIFPQAFSNLLTHLFADVFVA